MFPLPSSAEILASFKILEMLEVQKEGQRVMHRAFIFSAIILLARPRQSYFAREVY